MFNLQESITAWKVFEDGYKTFKKSGRTPHEAYVAMRKLFVETNGWFNDIFQFFYGFNKKCGPNMPLGTSIIPNFSQADINEAVHNLRTEGYYVFKKRIPDQFLDKLLDFALKTPCVLQYDDSQKQEQNKNLGMGYFQLGHVVYDSNELFNPLDVKATNYRIPPQEVLNFEPIQELMADPVIVNVAQEYMRSQVLFSLLGLWWTTPFGCDKPSSALAQKYHFDMDRIKFINFFLYVTDVGTGDGPHCYVKNSCKRKPKSLRRDGRFDDDEIENNYDDDEIVRVIAPRGTLIVGDTRAFHKAEMPKNGNRLILNFELATCMFGASYPKIQLNAQSEKLQSALSHNPHLWSNFDIENKKVIETKSTVHSA
ncbi:MAG: phytanoyl-CoA dioxygenase family protein [Candidatus Melainabacteria bacterium]|nr:phytanoyl-CoA dioxygenase family protein [Candidatus Melainabacteria bacterium]